MANLGQPKTDFSAPTSFETIPQLDTSCYPLIRKDQLSLLEIGHLDTLLVDLESFCIPFSMKISEDDKQMYDFAKQLARYIKRQRDHRLAAKRVATLLNAKISPESQKHGFPSFVSVPMKVVVGDQAGKVAKVESRNKKMPLKQESWLPAEPQTVSPRLESESGGSEQLQVKKRLGKLNETNQPIDRTSVARIPNANTHKKTEGVGGKDTKLLPSWIADSNVIQAGSSEQQLPRNSRSRKPVSKKGNGTKLSTRLTGNQEQESPIPKVKQFVVSSGLKSKRVKRQIAERQEKIMEESKKRQREKRKNRMLKKTMQDRKEVLVKLKDRMNRRKEWENERQERIEHAKRELEKVKLKKVREQEQRAQLMNLNGVENKTSSKSPSVLDDATDEEDDDSMELEDVIDEENAAQAIDESGQESQLLDTILKCEDAEDNETSCSEGSCCESEDTGAATKTICPPNDSGSEEQVAQNMMSAGDLEPVKKDRPSLPIQSFDDISLVSEGMGEIKTESSVAIEPITTDSCEEPKGGQATSKPHHKNIQHVQSRSSEDTLETSSIRSAKNTGSGQESKCNFSQIDQSMTSEISPTQTCFTNSSEVVNSSISLFRINELPTVRVSAKVSDDQGSVSPTAQTIAVQDSSGEVFPSCDAEILHKCSDRNLVEPADSGIVKEISCEVAMPTGKGDMVRNLISVSSDMDKAMNDSKHACPVPARCEAVNNETDSATTQDRNAISVTQYLNGESLILVQSNSRTKLSSGIFNKDLSAKDDDVQNDSDSASSKGRAMNTTESFPTTIQHHTHEVLEDYSKVEYVPGIQSSKDELFPMTIQHDTNEVLEEGSKAKHLPGIQSAKDELFPMTIQHNTNKGIEEDSKVEHVPGIPRSSTENNQLKILSNESWKMKLQEASLNANPNSDFSTTSNAREKVEENSDTTKTALAQEPESCIFIPRVIQEQQHGPSCQKQTVPDEINAPKSAPRDILPTIDYSAHYTSFESIFTNFTREHSGVNRNHKSAVEAWFREHFKAYDYAKRTLTSESYCISAVDPLDAGSSNKLIGHENASDIRWQSLSNKLLYRVVSRSRSEVYNIVTKACKKLNEAQGNSNDSKATKETWLQLPKGSGLKNNWNLLWTWSKPKVDWGTLLCWQKVNHFPGARVLTRKDLLKSQLQRFQLLGRRMQAEFEVLPPTFILPKEYLQFVDAFSTSAEIWPRRNFWIMKPVGLSRGRGISLISDIGDVTYGQSVVVQRYLHDPLLLDGYKFDLRLYVLVTSFQPLEAFMYDEGFVRMSTHPFSADESDLKNLFIHLTNSSIQKLGPNGSGIAATATSVARHSAEFHEAGGTKLSLSYLWRRLRESGVSVDRLQRQIRDVVLKSLIAANENIPNHPSCFEVYGYDILIDRKLKPWLIEVNSSPSMSVDNTLDRTIKSSLIEDTINLLDPLPFDRCALHEVLARRISELEQERLKPYSVVAESSSQEKLNQDLTRILKGRVPRSVGEDPENLGKYRRLCPNTPEFDRIMSLKGCSLGAQKTNGEGKKSRKNKGKPTCFRSSYLWSKQSSRLPKHESTVKPASASTPENTEKGFSVRLEQSAQLTPRPVGITQKERKLVFADLASSAGVTI